MFTMLKSLARRSRTIPRPQPFAVKPASVELLASRPWVDMEVPAEALAVPTMLSLRERQLLHWLGRYHVSGAGRIVDGGCFLGGSTAAFACGLAARSGKDWKNAPWKKTIVAYDMFRVEDYTLQYYGDCFPNKKIGSSFRSSFEKFTAPWSDQIEIKEGDACKTGWNGDPIEVLFLDFVKTWPMNDLFLEQFLPCVIPGRTVIIQQDYLWGYGHWIHITMELLAPYVKLLDGMPHGSVAYLLTSPVPQELIGAKLRTSLSPERKRELMNRAVDRWEGDDRGLVELARVTLTAELEGKPAARAEFKEVRSRYSDRERVEQSAACLEPYLK
jgi:hypothetical protein